MDRDQIFIFENSGILPASSRYLPVARLATSTPGFGRSQVSGGGLLSIGDGQTLMVAEQADTVQRFKSLKDSARIGSLVEQVAQKHQAIIGCRSNRVQEGCEFATAAVNVSDENCRHKRGRILSECKTRGQQVATGF